MAMEITNSNVTMSTLNGITTITHEYDMETADLYTEISYRGCRDTMECKQPAIQTYLNGHDADQSDLWDLVQADPTEFMMYVIDHAEQGTWELEQHKGEPEA